MKRFLNFKVFAILLLSILTIGLTSCGAINALPNLVEVPITESSTSESSINESSKSEVIIEQPKNDLVVQNEDKVDTNKELVSKYTILNTGKAIDDTDNWSVQFPNDDPNYPRCFAAPLTGFNKLHNDHLNYNNDVININLRGDSCGTTANSSGLRVELDGKHFNLKTSNHPDGINGFEFNYNFTLDCNLLNDFDTTMTIGQVLRLATPTACAKPFIMIYVRNDMNIKQKTLDDGTTAPMFPEARAGIASVYAVIRYYEGENNKSIHSTTNFFLGEVQNNQAVNINVRYDDNQFIIQRDNIIRTIPMEEHVESVIDHGLVCKTGLYYSSAISKDVDTNLTLKNVYYREW